MNTVEKWGLFEVSLKGPSAGNPFTEQSVSATFRSKNEIVTVDGFYDGDGVYKVRFMPSFTGDYVYETVGSFPEAESAGDFTVTEPTGNNHGPVRIANTYHFAYEDTTPYYSVGTTCYAWAQNSALPTILADSSGSRYGFSNRPHRKIFLSRRAAERSILARMASSPTFSQPI